MPQRHRMELSESVSGERPITYRRTARTFSAGRTCAVDDCPTVLSIYNSSPRCAAHADPGLGRRRGAASHPTTEKGSSEAMAAAAT